MISDPKSIKLIAEMQRRYLDIIQQSFEACEHASKDYERLLDGKMFIEKNNYLLHIRGLKAQVLAKLRESLIEASSSFPSDTKH